MMQTTDEQLLVRVGVGDALAFGEFYDRYAGRVCALILHLLRDQTETDDVLQETFWQVWRTATSYDARRAHPVAWLLLIARSRAIDALRRRGRNPVKALEGSLEEDQPVASQIEAVELGDRVQGALAQLNDNQRHAIQLAFYHGLSHPEIAHRLSIPLGTAKTRIRQGMITLRNLLGGMAWEVHE